MPTPCSPVMVPPTSTDSSRILPPKAGGALHLALDVGVEHDQRMQVAVAGVEDVGAAQAVFLRQLGDARQHMRQVLARDGAVHAQ
jgi:hypothetical protein